MQPESRPASEEGLPAIGPLRDLPPASVVQGAARPVISEYNNHKIRNLCLLLSMTVVLDHSMTWDASRYWPGESIARPVVEETQVRPAEAWVEEFLSGALGRITNPTFFAVSAYLFFWAWTPDLRSLRRKWRRRAFTLVVPWLVWGALGKLLWLADFLWSHRVALARMHQSGHWGWPQLIRTYYWMALPSQLWFLEQLILLMLLVIPLLVFMLPRLRAWTLLPIAILYFSPLQDTAFFLRKSGLCFFVLGAVMGYLAQPLVVPSRQWAWRLTSLWIGVAIVFTAVALRWNTPIASLYRILVLIGLMGAWAAYDLVPPACHRALSSVARFRFFIYMGFDPLLPILQRHWEPALTGSEAGRLLSYFLFPAVVITICLAAAWTLYRAAPAVYFIITGGRMPDLQPATGFRR